MARSDRFREFAVQSMTGTSGRQRVQVSALGQFPVPLPPQRLCAEFGKVVGPKIAQASLLAKESKTLATTRDALLPKLISGEICVPQAEQAVSAAIGHTDA